MRAISRAVSIGLILALPAAQAQVSPAAALAQSQAQQQPLPPATKLEGFHPSAGSVVMFGFDDLGSTSGVNVEVRELRDTKGISARGLAVEVTQSEYRKERSFVDADEVAELLKGIDAVADVTANPTKLANFEVRYETRGGLQVTAFNSGGRILYAIQVGRTLKAQRVGLSSSQFREFRDRVAKGLDRLGELTPK
jgi:hypothetical protein